MKKTIVAIAAVSLSLALFACAKKKEPVEVAPPPPKEEKEYVPPRAEAPQEDPLEVERRRLEDMMNKIMANDVYFEFDQATLTSEAKDILTEVGTIMKREPRFAILTEGHTDERGTQAYNLGLGTRRAEAVVKFLVNFGVEESRLSKRSLGKEQPKAEGQSEEAWAQNRRAAFQVQINR